MDKRVNSIALSVILLASTFTIFGAFTLFPQQAEAQGLQLRVSAAERPEFQNNFFGAQIVQIIIDDPGATDADDSTVGLKVKGFDVPRVHLRDGLWYAFIAESAAFLALSDLLSDGVRDNVIAVQTNTTAADAPAGFTLTQDTAPVSSFIRDITAIGGATFIEVDQDILFPTLPDPFLGGAATAANPNVDIADDPDPEDGDGTCDGTPAAEFNAAASECDWPFIRLFPLIETDIVAIRAGSASVDLTFDDFPDSITSGIDRTAAYPVDAEVIVQFTDYQWNMNPVEEDVVTFVLDKDTGTPNRIVYQPTRNFPDKDANGTPDNVTIANADFFNTVFVPIDFDGRQVLELDVPEGISTIKYTFFFDATSGAIETFVAEPNFTAEDARTIANLANADDPAVRMIESDPNTSFFESIDEAEGSRSNVFTAANDKVASWDYFDIINSSAMTKHDGFATVDKEVYDSADRAVFTVTDPDFNLRSRISETKDARESKNRVNVGTPIPIINTRTTGIFDTKLNKVSAIWDAIFANQTDTNTAGVDVVGAFVRVDVNDNNIIATENPSVAAGNEVFEANATAIVAINLTDFSNNNDLFAIRYTPNATALGQNTTAIIIDTNLKVSEIGEIAVNRTLTAEQIRSQVRIDNLQDRPTDLTNQLENFLVETARMEVLTGSFANKVVGRDVALSQLAPSDTVRVSIPKYNLIQLDTNSLQFFSIPAKTVVQIQAIHSSAAINCSSTNPTIAFAAGCVVGVTSTNNATRIGATQIVDFTPFGTPITDTDGDPATGDDWSLLNDPLTGSSDVGFNRDPTNKRSAIGSFRALDLVDIVKANGTDPENTFIRFTILFLDSSNLPFEALKETSQVLVLDVLGLGILFDPPSTGNAPNAAVLSKEGTFSNMIYRLEMDEAGSNSSIFSASADFMTVSQFDTVRDLLNEIVTIGDPVKVWLPNRFIPPNRLAFTYFDEDIVEFFRSTSATFIYETRDGKIEWDRSSYSFGQDAFLTLIDEDLNKRPDATERFDVPVDSFVFFELQDKLINNNSWINKVGGFSIDATFLETGPNTGTFVAQITMGNEVVLFGDEGTDTIVGTADDKLTPVQQFDIEANYLDVRDKSSNTLATFTSITNVRTELGRIILDRSVYPPGPGLQAGTLLNVTPTVELVGSIMYIEIVDSDFNLDPDIRDVLDLTRTVDFSPATGDPADIRDIFEIKIFNGGGSVPVRYSANLLSSILLGGDAFPILDRNLNQVTQAIETGPNTNTFEFEFQIYCPDINPDLFGPFLPVCKDTVFQVPVFKSNSPIEVIFNDPEDESGLPEDVEASAVIQTQTAVIGSDKKEYRLGEEALVFVIEPDFNLDSRTTEIMDFNFVGITTDQTPVEEIPLGLLLAALRALGEFTTEELGFRESDENSGIFAIIVPEGAVDETVATRGSEIELVYKDQTPSGGGAEIRVEYEVLVKETLPEIIFDKEEYTPFDEVSFRIISPDSNDEPEQIQRIRVLVSTSSSGGFFINVPETGPNTGIFEEDFTLTPNSDFFLGDFIAIREDGLSIEFRIDEDTVVTKSVFINYHVGNVMFDRDAYATNERAVISVIDPDENKNPDTIDTLDIRIWSTSDRGGLLVTLRETGDRTGIFEEFLTFTIDEESTGTRLRVSDGDTITAKYTDRTLPAPAALDNDGVFTVEVEELFASALIGSSTPPLERTRLTEPELVDQNGFPIEEVQVDRQVLVQSEIANRQNVKQKFVYIVQIKDSDGVTTSLSWVSGELPPKDSIVAAQSWIPANKGNYEIEVFVWESIDNPTPVSPTRKTSITVS